MMLEVHDAGGITGNKLTRLNHNEMFHPNEYIDLIYVLLFSIAKTFISTLCYA